MTARRGLIAHFMQSLSSMKGDLLFRQLHEGIRNQIWFAIGEAVHGHLNVARQEIFGSIRFPHCIHRAQRALLFFVGQSLAARRAVDTWTLCGIRCGLIRDIRILIAKIVWAARLQAEYGVGRRDAKRTRI